jgi:hypothetical protein
MMLINASAFVWYGILHHHAGALIPIIVGLTGYMDSKYVSDKQDQQNQRGSMQSKL